MESPPIIMGSPPDSLSPPMTGKNKISPPNIFGSKTCKSPHGDGGGDETMNMNFSHTDEVKIQNNIFNQYCIITSG